MSMPQRPRDGQLANIIDKLAEFVARNGPEFENMTKIKQQNNAKFSFLYHGSEFNNYYNYRVTEERRNLLGESVLFTQLQCLTNRFSFRYASTIPKCKYDPVGSS